MQPEDQELIGPIGDDLRHAIKNSGISSSWFWAYLQYLNIMELKRANDRVEGTQKTEESKT